MVRIVNRFEVNEFMIFSEFPIAIHMGHCDKLNVPPQFNFVCDETADIQITDLRDPRDMSAEGGGPGSVRIIWPQP